MLAVGEEDRHRALQHGESHRAEKEHDEKPHGADQMPSGQERAHLVGQAVGISR